MRDKIEKILKLQGCEGYDVIGEILSLIAPELEKAEKYDELYSAASDVMRCLDTFGAKIIPHLMDTDDNPGQRLRDALNQPEVKP